MSSQAPTQSTKQEASTDGTAVKGSAAASPSITTKQTIKSLKPTDDVVKTVEKSSPRIKGKNSTVNVTKSSSGKKSKVNNVPKSEQKTFASPKSALNSTKITIMNETSVRSAEKRMAVKTSVASSSDVLLSKPGNALLRTSPALSPSSPVISAPLPSTPNTSCSSTLILSNPSSKLGIPPIPESTTSTAPTTLTSQVSAGPSKFTSKSRRATPPKLTRQHSLAAMLGLVKNKEMKEIDKRERWPPVYEEDEGKSNGSSSERSHSMSYMPGQAESYAPRPSAPLQMYYRRSSCTGDLPGGLLPPPPRVAAVIRRKPAPIAQPPDKRRCSLTLPYATLYGSWQQTCPVTSPNSMELTAHISPQQNLIVTNKANQIIKAVKSPSTIPEQLSLTDAVNKCKDSSTTTPLLSPATSVVAMVPLASPNAIIENIPISPNSILSASVQYQRTYFLPQLMASSLQKVPMKDFGSEVRASLDIAHFLQSAVMLLDVQDTTLDGITDLLLAKVLEQDEPMCSLTEAKSILFTTDTGEYS